MINTPNDRFLTCSNGVTIRRVTFKSNMPNSVARQVFCEPIIIIFCNRIKPAWNAFTEKISQATTLNDRNSEANSSTKLKCLGTSREKLPSNYLILKFN